MRFGNTLGEKQNMGAMKYLVINNERITEEQYWSYCEKEHNPFIIVKNRGACYMEI